MIQPEKLKGSDSFYHPTNEQDVIDLVTFARANKLKVRVRGSAHSVPAAIYTDNFDEAPPSNDRNINIILDKMCAIAVDPDRKQVTVQAGCHLGYDPYDPTHTSTEQNSLFHHLQQHNLAFPDMGGIVQQTVAGFLSTGSSGGSLQYSLGKQIREIQLVDGTGKLHVLSRDAEDNDLFLAVGVSMGLMGIIVSVTFDLVDTYNIVGQESVHSYDTLPINIFGEDSKSKHPSLEQFFRDTAHSRLNWWPQAGVEKFIIWQAEVADPMVGFQRQPYEEFPPVPLINSQWLASQWFTLFRGLNPPGASSFIGRVFNKVVGWLFPVVVNQFLAGEVGSAQHFQDIWWKGLPMDQNVDYKLLPVKFTEIWIDIAQATEVMRRLRKHYAQGGFNATGTTVCEIYATEKSKFWLSPAYDRDVIKIDLFWFGYNVGDPAECFYPQFWELLKDLNYRLHWGKALSNDASYISKQYPRWQDFMRVRATMDPDQIFVSDYWRQHLGIPQP